MRAIVLSGGGAKGAYEIGVWKALRKLHYSYDIVTGTSVGALNAALMVQRDYLKAVWLWYHMDYRVIFGRDFDAKEALGDKNIIAGYAKNFFRTGGMDIQGLESTIDRCLKIKKFYRSPIDFGLVTVRFPSLKPVIMTKNMIPKDQLKDYLVASASCFPAFKMKNIEEESYFDGGFYDNLPINLAIEMGATEIIAVDLEAIGRKRRVRAKGIPITIISPRNEIGSFLIFEKEITRRGIRLGYNDTMKTFQELDGNLFTFKKGHLQKNYEEYAPEFFETLDKLLNSDDNNSSLIDKILHLSAYKRLLNKETKRKTFDHIIEKLGKILLLPDDKIYDIFSYNELLKEKFYETATDSFEELEEAILKKSLWLVRDSNRVVHYIYYQITKEECNMKQTSIYNLAILFPEEFMASLYLKTLLIR